MARRAATAAVGMADPTVRSSGSIGSGHGTTRRTTRARNPAGGSGSGTRSASTSSGSQRWTLTARGGGGGRDVSIVIVIVLVGIISRGRDLPRLRCTPTGAWGRASASGRSLTRLG
jgi:hypothetical protein